MTETINSISDFEKYLKNTKKVVEEAVSYTHLTLPTTVRV